MRKNNKGFTLTELIIVIVIIGILAGVLIPALSGYVARSRVSADEQMVKGMNTVLQASAIDEDVAYFDSIDKVKAILAENGVSSFTSKSKKNTIWYDRSDNTVKLLNTEDALKTVSAAAIDEYSYQLEQVSKNPALLYLDQRDNEITKTLNKIANYVNNLNAAPTDEAFTALYESKLPAIARQQLDKFLPSKTLFVNANGYYTAATAVNTTGTVSVYNVLFAKEIKEIGNGTNVPNTIHNDEKDIDLTVSIKVLNGIYIPSTLDVSKLTEETKMLQKLEASCEVIVNQADESVSVKLVSLNLGCDVIINSNKSNAVELTFNYVRTDQYKVADYKTQLNNQLTTKHNDLTSLTISALLAELHDEGKMLDVEFVEEDSTNAIVKVTFKLENNGEVNTLFKNYNDTKGEIKLDVKTNYVIDFTGKELVFKSVTDYGLTTLTVYCYDEDKVVAAGIVKYIYLTE